MNAEEVHRKTGRIVWVDLLRGICMLMILWFHTEMYYTGYDVIPYNAYVDNALTTFYFISGYLFVRDGETYSRRKKLRSILSHILLPYFFFTTLLALPKALANHLPVGNVLSDILLGQASWFISSLVVAELIFMNASFTGSKWRIYSMQIACLLLAYLLTGSSISLNYNYWNFHSALVGLFFLCLGYQYRQCEERCFQLFNRPLSFTLLLIFFIIIKVYVIGNGISMLVAPVDIASYPLFLADTIAFILLLTTVAKRMPNLTWLAWTGRHSLVYYFFCGAVPMAVAMAFNGLGFSFCGLRNYFLIPLAFLLVYALTSIVAWLAYRYLRFLR